MRRVENLIVNADLVVNEYRITLILVQQALKIQNVTVDLFDVGHHCGVHKFLLFV
jgi:hypothetical protein